MKNERGIMHLQELKKTYDQDGFLRIETFLSESRVREIEEQLEQYLKDVVPFLPPGDVVYETGGSNQAGREIRILFRMEEHSPYFAQLAQDPALLELVGALVNGQAISTGVELFAKPARIGGAVPYHQDNGYFNLIPPDALTCWLALDDSGLENGCVYYARGSHRQGLLPHKASLVPGNSWGLARVPDSSELDEVPGIIRRGGAMLHHCLTLHRSERNLSDRPRRGLLIVYKGAHCQLEPVGLAAYQAAAQALQEHLAAQSKLK